MGFFSIFSGRSPESHEHRGDEYTGAGAFGDAVIEYEKAIDKIEKHYPEKVHLRDRLAEKMRTAGNSLAKNHMENAEAIARAGDLADARELYHLALELAEDKRLKTEIEKRLSFIDTGKEAVDEEPVFVDGAAQPEEWYEEDEEDTTEEKNEEIFRVLCNALPQDLQEAYRSYGKSFAAGYVALNEGNFALAEEKLAAAINENPAPDLIPLELATAYIHLDEHEQAIGLLESFIGQNPEQPRAYQLLCEMYWEKKEYDRANSILSKAPESIKDKKAMLMLLGENHFQKKDYSGAESVFENYTSLYGKDEIVSRALAKTMEASGRLTEARDLYAQAINAYQSRGAFADPFLKRRYAELCFQNGDTSSTLLEIYMGLVKEDPDNRVAYFKRISEIYYRRGENEEARRFEDLAKNTG